MKKFMSILFIMILCSTFAYADEVDQGLPKQTSEQLKTNTREMIRLGVQNDDALKMTRLMVQNRFQVENTIQAQEIVMNAKKQGLPEGPIMNKAYEGIAKKVQAGSIVQAMEKTRERYEYSYQKAQALGVNKEEVAPTGNVIAEGMAAGLANQDVDAVCDRLQTRDRLRDKDGDEDGTKDQTRDQKRDREQLHVLAQESFMTAREMVRRGVPSDMAADAVCQALQNNYQAREMQQLRYTFMQNAANGDPVQLANRYAKALRQGTQADDLGHAGGQGQGTGGAGSGSDSPNSGGSDSGMGGSGSSSDGPASDGGGSSSGGSDSGSAGSGSSGSGSGSGGSGSGSGSGSGGKK
jgi:hypothetical protein